MIDLEKNQTYILIRGGDEVPDPNQVKTLVISLNSGIFTDAQTVTITTDTNGATIYYTTDGSTPDSTDIEYTTPFIVDSVGTTTLKARAVVAGMTASGVATTTIVFELPSIDVGAALEDFIYDAANHKVYAIDYYNRNSSSST